jgi:hypothetical protein
MCLWTLLPPNIWEPKSINGGNEKYSVSIIIPKSDKETLAKIEAAVKVAYEEGKSTLKGNSKALPKLADIKTPLRDGDKERPGDEAYEGSFFLNANSTMQPDIIDRYRDEITDQKLVYSGCYCKFLINFYAFSASGNKGIACGLNGIQLIPKGEPLGGRRNAKDAFDIKEDDDDFLG